MIELSSIRTDGGTQARAAINEETVAEYAEAMEDENNVFPPITVYYDGKDYWLADGFHRVAAWKSVGRIEVPAEIRQGDRRRAILHSVAANSVHGLRRTNADKRRAVMTLLEDDEWARWTDSEIARRCGVSQPFVSKLRGEASSNGYKMPTKRTVERGGVTYQQDTSKIGRKADEIPSETEGDITTGPERPDGGSHGSRAASGRSDASSGAGDTAEEGEEPAAGESPAPDPHAVERQKLEKLTRQGLEDEVIGLRADLVDEKSRRKTAEIERDALRAQVKELTSDEDAGRKIGNLQRRLTQAEGRSKEHQATAARLQRQVNAQKAEIDALTKRIEGQEIAL